MAKKKIPRIPPGEARFRNPEDRDFTIMPNVVFFGYPELSAGARWLYYLLRSYAWGDKAYSYPTIGGLAKIQGVSEVTLGKRLKELTQVKLITVERQSGYRNLYWIEPLSNTPQAGFRGQADEGGQDLNKQIVEGTQEDENETSLSLSQIAERYERPGNRKSFLTTLTKFPLEVVANVVSALEQQVDRHGDGAIENAAAYITKLLPIFAQAHQQAQAAQEGERQALYRQILATAVFEADSKPPEAVRQRLLAYWPGETDLVDKALALVAQ